jgi:predicted ArsR family transcriptional regulator
MVVEQTPLGETKQRILVLLLDGQTTAESLASRTGMNLSVVRRHLEDMVAQNLVDSAFRRTGRGRPSKLYSITVEGRTVVSSKYDLVADLLTMAAQRDLSQEKTLELYATAGRILAAGAGKHDSPRTLLPLLADLGFQPELRKEVSKQFLVSKNCPVLKLAQKYPILTCDTFHTVFLKEALGGHEVTLIQDIARGASECKHEL